MRAICKSGSMSEVWRRSYGIGTWAPPDERGGNRQPEPTTTAPHLDSTDYGLRPLLETSCLRKLYGFALTADGPTEMKVAVGLPSVPEVVMALTSRPGFRPETPTSFILVTDVSLLTNT